MLSFGMLCARAAWIALRRRGFPVGSPPVLAAMVISLDNLLKIFPRFASIAPFKRLTFDHLLCPAILRSYVFLTCKLRGLKSSGFRTARLAREWLTTEKLRRLFKDNSFVCLLWGLQREVVTRTVIDVSP